MLESDGDDWHQNGLQMGEHIRCAFQGKYECSNGLEDTERCDAFVVKEIAIAVTIFLGALSLDELTYDPNVSVA